MRQLTLLHEAIHQAADVIKARGQRIKHTIINVNAAAACNVAQHSKNMVCFSCTLVVLG
jgi:hypothetical protein